MTGRRRRDGRLWAALFCRLFGGATREAEREDGTPATTGDDA